ncbi:DUF5119 domain-containing protein [Bacteroides zoogleoformans]|uniref:DUF5119 domain-containing protein n=1 Tax=Bacteroides zoogleoformans TaxID=28119 RepID=UPI00248DFFDE|nr:DUF5119 domain-containing protein [Bacteroides zoogleoformans]
MKTENMMKTGRHPLTSRPLRALGTAGAAVALTLCAALIAALITGTLSSCDHKTFCDPEPAVSRVHVVFDWRNAPGATAKTMSLYLYPENENEGEVLRYDFDNAAGGVVAIPHGTYKALFMNNDTETVLLRGTDRYETLEAYTRPAYLLEPLGLQSNPKDANPSGEAVALPPDRFWAGSKTDMKILPAKAAAGVPYDQEVTFHPVQETSRYTVEIRNARNLKYASALSFSLSGLSGCLTVAGGKRSPLRTMIPFEGRSDEVASVITGECFAFGLSTSANKMRTLALYVILTNGNKQYYTFDVATQVNNAPDPKNVHIVIDGLDLPKPIVEEGGGFKPSVDDWVGENVEVEM